MSKTITVSRAGVPVASFESLIANRAMGQAAQKGEHLQVALPLYAPAPKHAGDDNVATSDPFFEEDEVASDI